MSILHCHRDYQITVTGLVPPAATYYIQPSSYWSLNSWYENPPVSGLFFTHDNSGSLRDLAIFPTVAGGGPVQVLTPGHPVGQDGFGFQNGLANCNRGSDPSFDFSGSDLSLMGWFNLGAFDGAFESHLCGCLYKYQLLADPTTAQVSMSIQDVALGFHRVSVPYPADSAFHRVVGQYKRLSQEIGIQVDNGAMTTLNIAAFMGAGGNNFRILNNNDLLASGTDYIVADEIYLYNKVLTPAFLLDNWNAGAGTQYQSVGTALAITNATPLVPGATKNIPYTNTFLASGDTGTLQWSKSAGSFGTGSLALDPDTGVLAGTPTVQGTKNFTIQVIDAWRISPNVVGYMIVTKAFQLVVAP